MKDDRFVGLMMAVGYILVVLALVFLLASCGKSNVKPDPELVLVKAPAEVRIEKILVEVPSPIDRKVLKDYPCKYPEGRPLSEFYEVNDKQHGCLKVYETLIDGLIKKYGVK